MPSLTWEIKECVKDVDPMLVVLDKLVGIQSANLRPNKTLSLLMLLIRITINCSAIKVLCWQLENVFWFQNKNVCSCFRNVLHS